MQTELGHASKKTKIPIFPNEDYSVEEISFQEYKIGFHISLKKNYFLIQHRYFTECHTANKFYVGWK